MDEGREGGGLVEVGSRLLLLLLGGRSDEAGGREDS